MHRCSAVHHCIREDIIDNLSLSRATSAMSFFVRTTARVNGSPIPDTFCKCDVRLRQKEIFSSPVFVGEN